MAELELSFTRVVKEEVSSLAFDDVKEAKALLSGFIKINSHLILRNNKWNIEIKSENIKTAKLIISLLDQVYQVKCGVKVSEEKRFKIENRTKVFHIEINDKAKEILKDLEIYNEEDGFNCLPNNIAKDLEAKKFLLTGCFLASGSVNSPKSSNYHLEIATSSEEYAKYLVSVFKKFYIEPKYIARRNLFVVYVKKSESIEDFLRIMRASNSMIEFADVRIQRDMVNSQNRILNCEISNAQKAIEIGNEQADKIRWYKENYGFSKLSNKLKVIAEVRLASPDATYNELVSDLEELHGLVISKPGLAYRMNKLIELINEVKGE